MITLLTVIAILCIIMAFINLFILEIKWFSIYILFANVFLTQICFVIDIEKRKELENRIEQLEVQIKK
jgi:hypothetical protein